MIPVFCRFCRCCIAPKDVSSLATFYYVGNESEPRRTCKAESCLLRASREIQADERRRAA